MRAIADLLIQFGTRTPTVFPRRNPGSVTTTTPGANWVIQTEQHASSVPRLLHEISEHEWSVWTIGEVYRYGDRKGDTNTCIHEFMNDHLREQARPESLAGNFALFAWTPALRRWSVWTNRVASVHVYFTEGQGKPLLGTFSPALYTATRGSLDWAGLTGFFSFGFFPEDRTYDRDVRILRPASRYDFTEDGKLVSSTSYWKWFHAPDPRRSEPDTIAEFGDILKAAVLDQTRYGRVVLPLSGGLDSRTVAACLPQGCAVRTYSYGYSNDSVEIRIAKQIARRRDLDFTEHTIKPYLFDQLETVLSAVEGFQDVTQARQAQVADWLSGSADYVIGAHWGDVLCDDMGLPAGSHTSSQVLDHSIHKLEKRGRQWLLENIAAPRLEGVSADVLLREMMEREIASHATIADDDFRVKALKTTQWAFRWTLASLRMYQAGAFPRIPFLDPKVIDFFCTVPTAMVRGRRLQVEYLKRFAPDLARIRWQVHDANLFHYRYSGPFLLPKRAIQKAVRTLTRKKVLQRNWEVQYFAPGQWTRLEQQILQSPVLERLVAASQATNLLERFRQNPTPEDGYTVSMLLTTVGLLKRAHPISVPAGVL